jgi:hypothetical protein
MVTVVAGYFMQNPPQGWTPKGWAPTASQASQRSDHDYTLREALGTWQWWALWLLLFNSHRKQLQIQHLERSTKRILPAGFSVMKVWTDPVQTFPVTLAAAG